MAYILEGQIKLIGEIQTFPSGFYKREFVVTTDEKYPQDIRLDALKEKADMLNDFKENDAVKVSFNIRGREYNGRYYVDLSAWKIERADGSSSSNTADEAYEPADTTDYSESDDEIPF